MIKCLAFSVVRVIDCLLHAAVEPRVIQNDFSGMHRFDGVGLNDELASILDVDHELAAVWRNFAHRAELFAAVVM
jgi:hypothetical protein